MRDPICKRFAGAISYLEAYRRFRFALYDGRARFDGTRGTYVCYPKSDQIAASQFAVDSHIEKGQVAYSAG